MKVRQYCRTFGLLTALLCLLSGCSDDDTTPRDAAAEIRFNADVWRVMEGTRATTVNAGPLTNCSFMVYAFYNTTTTCYINGEVVNFTSGESSWVNRQNWPRDNSALDFFAYMPATLPSYISFDSELYNAETNPDGYSAGTPRIVCTDLPMTYNSAEPTAGQGGLQEFVYAMTFNQDEENKGQSGVTMKFYHPFARIRFQLAASHPDIIINSITFKGLKTGGTCTFSFTPPAPPVDPEDPGEPTDMNNTSTWSSLTGSSNFVMTLTGDSATFNTNPAVQPIGGYADDHHQSVDFIMVPQTFAGEIEVNATWIDWGEQFAHTVSTSVPTTWLAGYSYTYTFTIRETDLRVDIQKFTEQW